MTTPLRFLGIAGFALAAALCAPASAQTDAGSASSAPGNLPTVGDPNRAYQGGLTDAHPSLAGINGSSPLEPYLVTWLLPVSGILTAVIAVGVDRSLRKRVLR